MSCFKHFWAALGAEGAIAWKPILNSLGLGWIGAGRGRAVHGGVEVGGEVTGG